MNNSVENEKERNVINVYVGLLFEVTLYTIQKKKVSNYQLGQINIG